MEIGLVVYGGLDETSGGFRYDRQLVEYLRDCGDSVEVISLPWRSYWRGVVDGVSPAVSARLDQPVDVLIQDELCYPSLWRQNHRLTNPGAVVALVHLIQPDPQRGRLPWLRRRIERAYLDSVDAAISTSEFTRTQAAAVGPGISDHLVAPPAGRTEGRAVTEREVRQRSTEGPLRITYVGNIVPRKDLITLLSAVARLSPDYKCTDWELTVIGSREANPDYADAARARATELGVDDSVTFRGEVARDELTARLEASHVLCVPSRYEGFGMVYLEAMEYGVVPIAGSVGGAGEFITDGKNGALVDPGDVDRLAERLAELATDRDRLADCGVAALETAAAHPGWDETLAAVRSLLERLTTAADEPRASGGSATDSPTAAGNRRSEHQ